jgi:hypothetical protein
VMMPVLLRFLHLVPIAALNSVGLSTAPDDQSVRISMLAVLSRSTKQASLLRLNKQSSGNQFTKSHECRFCYKSRFERRGYTLSIRHLP